MMHSEKKEVREPGKRRRAPRGGGALQVGNDFCWEKERVK
jgi:hypothetical protein